jgi:RNA polymerase sigma-70 factor (ECF subfamily)
MPRPASQSARFDAWLAEHLMILYKVAYRLIGDAHEAEDVVQETFRSAWASRDRYDGDRSERAWLLSILRRRAADHWRRRERRQPVASPDLPHPTARPDDPFHDELSGTMQHALDRLPQDLRETLLLVVVGELTHQEAADLQGIPLGTVLSRVSRARGRLREYLLEARPAAARLAENGEAVNHG